MTNTIATTTNGLNGATVHDAQRTHVAGPAFSMLNALQGSGQDPATGLEAMNAATGANPEALLAELNDMGIAPRLAVALQGVRRAMDDQRAEDAAAAKGDDQHRQLQEQARKLVSQTFFGPMFKQMRNSPFKSELFAGGRGGEVFTSMLDQRLSEQMARGAGTKLVHSLVRRLEGIRRDGAAAAELQHRAEAPKAANPFENVRIHVAPAE